MKSRPKKSGSSTSWLDTVPMESNSGASPGKPRRSRSPPVFSPPQTSVWHRPLGKVVEDVAVKVAVKAVAATTASLSLGSRRDKKSNALTVVDKRSRPAMATALLLGAPKAVVSVVSVLGGTMRSIGNACMSWMKHEARRPSPPPAKRRKPLAPASKPIPLSAFPPAFVAPGANTAAAAAQGRDKVFSFVQELYFDAAKSLYYDSSNMGVLWVQEASGLKSTAGPEAKWYFLAVLKRFEELGEVMTRFNPKYMAMTRSFAEALLTYPTADPIWRQMVSDDPRSVARCFAGLDKPQNIIDIAPSSIHRVAARSSTSTTVSA